MPLTNPTSPNESLNYRPQLDGVRAIAITFVILAHWFAPFTTTGFFEYGEAGVTIFFVLSGFLITRILLDYKTGIEQGQASTGRYLKMFFIRRVLRIVPAYYLTIALVLLFKPAIFEGQAWWHCAYLSNFYFVLVKHGWQQPVAQWWSLSVEEQFYLAWPFLILLTNRKYLTYIMLAIILVGPLFRLLNPTHDYFTRYLTPACFDALGLGAMLALHYKWFREVLGTYLSLALILLSIAGAALFYRYQLPGNEVIQRVFLSVLGLVLVYNGAKGVQGVIGKLLANPIAVYIGRISYGIYICHFLLLAFDIQTSSIVLLQACRVVLLLAVTSLSYFLVERPLLKLKKYA